MKLHSQFKILLLISMAAHAVHSAIVDPTLVEVCKQTPDPKLCEETIAPKLRPGEKVTLTTALLKEIEVVSNEAKQAQQDADRRANSTDPRLVMIYRSCSDLFGLSQNNLQAASDALSGKLVDVNEAWTRISAAGTDFVTCNDCFEEVGRANPIAATTARLLLLAHICGTMAQKLSGGA